MVNSNGVEARASGSVDPALAELVERLTARLQAGEDLDEEEVLAEHPSHAERLRGLLPALRLVAALSEPGPEQPPGDHEETVTGTLGDFRLLREAGRGGMGVVYEALQISLGRHVALKVLPFAATMDPRHLQRFHNEARAAACLHHEHIVPVHSVGSERGVHYYAMQFIEGRTLAAVIHDLRQQAGLAAPQPAAEEAGVRTTPHVPGRGSPAAETAAQAGLSTQRLGRGKEFYRSVAGLGVQAALALDHAHQRGILHRDVKPANLLLDERGSVWVTDFGLAQLQHGEGNLTMTGDLLGTLRYMSPEQTLAKRVVIDQRTDVYSLGVTLYELLTLRPAFPGSDRAELLRQVAFEEPLPLRKLERGIPAELETIVLKAMEKNSQDRYATAQELADDLQRWLEHRPIQAKRPTLLQRTAKWAQRHRGAVTSAAAFLLLGLLGVSGALIVVAAAYQEKDAALEGTKRSLHEKSLALEARDQALVKEQQERARAEKEWQRAEQNYFGGLALTNRLGALAVDLHKAGDLRRASALAEHVVVLSEQLFDSESDYPGLSKAQEDAVKGMLNLAKALQDTGQHERGIRLLTKGMAHLERWALRHPEKQLRYKYQRAYMPEWLGIFHAQSGQPKAAEKAFRASLEAWEQLAAETDPRARHFHTFTCAKLWRRIATVQHDGATFDAAERSAGQALVLMAGLKPDDPTPELHLVELGYLHQALGDLYHEGGRFEKARAAYRKALDAHEESARKRRDGQASIKEHRWLLATCRDPQFRDLKRAEALGSAQADWLTVGAARLYGGNPKGALEALGKIIVPFASPEDKLTAHWIRTMAEWQSGVRDVALKHFRELAQTQEALSFQHREARRFREEAARMLGVRDGPKEGGKGATDKPAL